MEFEDKRLKEFLALLLEVKENESDTPKDARSKFYNFAEFAAKPVELFKNVEEELKDNLILCEKPNEEKYYATQYCNYYNKLFLGFDRYEVFYMRLLHDATRTKFYNKNRERVELPTFIGNEFPVALVEQIERYIAKMRSFIVRMNPHSVIYSKRALEAVSLFIIKSKASSELQSLDPLNFVAYLNEDGKSLLPFLIDTYKGGKIQDIAMMLLALQKLNLLTNIFLSEYPQEELAEAVGATFAPRTKAKAQKLTRQALNISKYNKNLRAYTAKIDKPANLIKAELQRLTIK